MAAKSKKTKKLKLNRRLVNQRGRIDWGLTENLLPIHIAIKEYPFHARVFAEKYGMSTSAVYYRLKQHGVSLSDLRNGTCGKGKELLDRYTVSKVNVSLKKELERTHEESFKPKNRNGVSHGKTKKTA